MTSRVEKLYQQPIFEQLQGLPERIVQFEALTGLSLPDIFSYTFLQVFDSDMLRMVIGRMGDFFVTVVEIENETNVRYELHENKQSFRLWALDVYCRLEAKEAQLPLEDEERKRSIENRQWFLEKVEQLTAEE